MTLHISAVFLAEIWALCVRLAAHVSKGGKVPNPPGRGEDIAEGKGVHRQVKSEGSWM